MGLEKLRNTVRPNLLTYIQREVIKRLFSAFQSAGIEFANATVSVRPWAPQLMARQLPLQPHAPDRYGERSGLTTGVQITRSMCGALVASMIKRSKPRAMPDASGIAPRAVKKSSSIG
jgi:hypothetical protein